MQAQEIVDEVQQPRWTRKALMSKFYPIHEKVLKKENPQVTGFKWAFKTPPAPTAEEVVETIEKEGVSIRYPLFSNQVKKRNKNG